MRALQGTRKGLRVLMLHIPGDKETARDLVWIKSVKDSFKESLGEYNTKIENVSEAINQTLKKYRGKSLNPDNERYFDPDFATERYALDDELTELNEGLGTGIVTVYVEESDYTKIKDRYFARKGMPVDEVGMELHLQIVDILDNADKVKPDNIKMIKDSSKDIDVPADTEDVDVEAEQVAV